MGVITQGIQKMPGTGTKVDHSKRTRVFETRTATGREIFSCSLPVAVRASKPLLESLRTDVFEPRTSTGSLCSSFSTFSCLTYELPSSHFSIYEIFNKKWVVHFKEEKFRLPVDVRGPKTSVLVSLLFLPWVGARKRCLQPGFLSGVFLTYTKLLCFCFV